MSLLSYIPFSCSSLSGFFCLCISVVLAGTVQKHRRRYLTSGGILSAVWRWRKRFLYFIFFYI